MKMPNALKAALGWFARRCTYRARFEEIGQPRASSLRGGPMAMNAESDAGRDERIRCRFSLAANAVASLRAGRRKDHSAVLRELRRAFDELSFLVTIFPQLSGNFTIKTALEIIDARISEIEAAIEEIAEKARRDADDDNGEDYAPRD